MIEEHVAVTAAHAKRVARHLDRRCADRGTQSTARTMTRSVPTVCGCTPRSCPSAAWSAAVSTRRAVAAPNTKDQTPARYLAGPHSAPKGGRADARRVERSSSEKVSGNGHSCLVLVDQGRGPGGGARRLSIRRPLPSSRTLRGPRGAARSRAQAGASATAKRRSAPLPSGAGAPRSRADRRAS